MNIEDIIKIVWRRKFYLLIPSFIVPLFAFFSLMGMTREYRSEGIVMIRESLFKHPYLTEFGVKLDLVERLPAIKKVVKGGDNLFLVLGEARPENPTPVVLEDLARKRDRIEIELKGPGVARIAYSASDPERAKSVVERASAQFVRAALAPFAGIGFKLREKLKRKDEILSVQITPKFTQAQIRYLEVIESFTEESPDLARSRHRYESWRSKKRSREIVVENKASEILPLQGDELDFARIAETIEPPSLPLIPFKPNKIKILAMAVLAGVSLGTILTLGMEFMDHSLKETGDIERYLGISVIGRVPSIKPTVSQGG